MATPEHGAVSLSGDGSFTYTPSAGFAGTDTFMYKARNGYVDSGLATVALIVGDPAATLTVGDVSVQEDDGTADVPLTLSNASPEVVSVDVKTVAGTAAAGQDFTHSAARLVWAAGETGTKTFSVAIADDGTPEPSEAFTVELFNALNCTVADGTGTVTIANDDKSIVSLSIDGPGAVDEMAGAQYFCTADYDDGSSDDVTSQAGWTDNSSVAGVSRGYVSTLAVESNQPCRVTATIGAVSNDADIVITDHQQEQALRSLAIQSSHGDCIPPVGSHNYALGYRVTNSVTPIVTAGQTRYVCTGWTLSGVPDIAGNYTGAGHEVIVDMTNNAELVWHWLTKYWVDVESVGPGNVDTVDSWEVSDSEFTVTAIPSNYCHFVCWSGSVDSVSNVLTVTVTAPLQLIGHFAATYATNGTPVWWLAAHGLTNADWNTEAQGDQDGDGHWTWQEYITGTDPTNILSVLSLANPQKVGDDIVVHWQSVADHEYSLSRATDLMQGFATIASPIPATPPMNTYTDSVSGMECMFYQVHTPPLPMVGHFDLGTVIDFLPTNQTYSLGYTIPVPLQNGDLLCTFCERSGDPSWTTKYIRHVLLGSDLSVSREPADLVDGYDAISRLVHHTDSDGAVFVAIRNSGSQDPMRFMRYSSATDTSVLVGTLNQWPTGAFSDNNLRNLVRTDNGKLVLFNGWRYNGWSTAEEDLYAMVSTNDMESWSAWIHGGRVGGEGTVTAPTCLPVSNDVVIACLQTGWGGVDNCVVTLFDAETQTFGSLIQVCDGELPRLFLDRDTGDLAIAYVDAGQVYVRYSSLDDPSTWSAASVLDSTAPTPCIDIATSSESPSPFVDDARYLLYTSSGEQRLYRWEGGTTWADLGALPKEYSGALSAGRVVADAQGRAVVVQLFEDGANYVTHVRRQ
ncbi:MAG: hypothetical protein GF341_08165 [candidate division Zixibacteria bacterium]|nr:hypothetical protein [candidate division Zixibacteria bacterium]